MLWDEANRLKAVKVGEYKLQHNVYDASGERVLKGIGQSDRIAVNGQVINTDPPGGPSNWQIGNYTTYASGYFVVDGYNQVSKHYFSGAERIASRLSGKYVEQNAERCKINGLPLSSETIAADIKGVMNQLAPGATYTIKDKRVIEGCQLLDDEQKTTK
ncbi:MAG: hypothetical protein IPQ04_07195 [Saprospiraceae bacterium]|nr:hypothetical protein [Saprospiraceae bacterium]